MTRMVRSRTGDHSAAPIVLMASMAASVVAVSEFILRDQRSTRAAANLADEVVLAFIAYVLFPTLVVSAACAVSRWLKLRRQARWYQVCCRGMSVEHRPVTTTDLVGQAVGSGTKLMFAMAAALLTFVLLQGC